MQHRPSVRWGRVCGPLEYLITHLVISPRAELVMFDNGVQCRWQSSAFSRVLQYSWTSVCLSSKEEISRTQERLQPQWKETHIYSEASSPSKVNINLISVCPERTEFQNAFILLGASTKAKRWWWVGGWWYNLDIQLDGWQLKRWSTWAGLLSN